MRLQKENVSLCEKYYGKDDERTIREKIILAWMKSQDSEKGAENLIEDVIRLEKSKVSPDKDILEFAYLAEDEIKDTIKRRKEANGENYVEFDDFNKLEFI